MAGTTWSRRPHRQRRHVRRLHNSGPQDLLLAVTDGMHLVDEGDPGYVPTVSIHTATSSTPRSRTASARGRAAAEPMTYLSRSDSEQRLRLPPLLRGRRGAGRLSLHAQQRAEPGAQLHRPLPRRPVPPPRPRLARLRRAHRHRRRRGLRQRRFLRQPHVGPRAPDVTRSQARWCTPGPGARPPHTKQQADADRAGLRAQDAPGDCPTGGPTSRSHVRERLHAEGTFDARAASPCSTTCTGQERARRCSATDLDRLPSTTTTATSSTKTRPRTASTSDDSVTRTVVNDPVSWLLGEVQVEAACSTGPCRHRAVPHDHARVQRLRRGAESVGETRTTRARSSPRLLAGRLGQRLAHRAQDMFGHYRQACMSYEPEGIFPYATVNQPRPYALLRLRPRPRRVRAAADPNGLTTQSGHDGFGRVTEELRPDAAWRRPGSPRQGRRPHGQLVGPQGKTTNGGGPSRTLELDGQVRPVTTLTHVAATESCGASLCAPVLTMEQDTQYDHLGRSRR